MRIKTAFHRSLLPTLSPSLFPKRCGNRDENATRTEPISKVGAVIEAAMSSEILMHSHPDYSRPRASAR
jgi:hypothetical protein